MLSFIISDNFVVGDYVIVLCMCVCMFSRKFDEIYFAC